jgi:hypothetical protein
MEAGIGEAFALIFAKETTVSKNNMVDLIARALPI